jgi:RNA polymerase sigma-70 factor (ECF subfamily)
VDTVLTEAQLLREDATLADRFRRGEAAAFDRVVRENRHAVYMTARRLLRRHEEADEAAQRAFVRAWRARAGFRGASSIRTWLIRITLNVSRSMLQASRKAGTDLSELERIPDARTDAEARLRRRQARERVREAVAKLPPRQREAVVLKVFSEMTCRETAEVMELSEGAVKAHLHQAVANLRRRMGGGEAGEAG